MVRALFWSFCAESFQVSEQNSPHNTHYVAVHSATAQLVHACECKVGFRLPFADTQIHANCAAVRVCESAALLLF